MVWSGSAGVRPRLGKFPKSGGQRAPVLGMLRRAHRLVWLVLAWFVLSIGAAIASPAIAAATGTMVCMEAPGHHHGHGHAPLPGHHHTGDCPLCVTAGAPPATVAIFIQQPAPTHAPIFWTVVHVAIVAAGPAPARGPPSI